MEKQKLVESETQKLVDMIDRSRTQSSANSKDELAVMRSMINDKDFKVDVYGKTGIVGTYCPYDDARMLVSKILTSATKIPGPEAAHLAESYEFSKQEAQVLVGLSKQFVLTYLDTGRKLPLGGRELSNISLAKKTKEARISTTPCKVGVNDDGTDKYENIDVEIPSHETVKVFAPCPFWLRNK